MRSLHGWWRDVPAQCDMRRTHHDSAPAVCPAMMDPPTPPSGRCAHTHSESCEFALSWSAKAASAAIVEDADDREDAAVGATAEIEVVTVVGTETAAAVGEMEVVAEVDRIVGLVGGRAMATADARASATVEIVVLVENALVESRIETLAPDSV
jgi:hypothetical protein